jgi:membrane protein YdbS with pleckstrin-like domain
VTLQVRRSSGALDAGIEGWIGVSPRLLVVEVTGVLVGGLVALSLALALLLVNDRLAWAAIAVVVVLTVVRLVLAARRIRAIGYVLREDDLVFRRGILYSRLVAVPYGRMQLIDVNRGPVARLMGLAELRLVTAAASSDVTIPGLPEAAATELRDRLIERAEQRRVGL